MLLSHLQRKRRVFGIQVFVSTDLDSDSVIETKYWQIFGFGFGYRNKIKANILDSDSKSKIIQQNIWIPFGFGFGYTTKYLDSIWIRIRLYNKIWIPVW